MIENKLATRGRKGILQYTLAEWKEYAEFNLNFDKEFEHVKSAVRCNLDNRRLYLLNRYCIKHQIPQDRAIQQLLASTGIFNYYLDFEGNATTKKLGSLNNKKIIDDENQTKLFEKE